MDRILIVGAGNIGSRHLQSLAKSRMPLEIVVVDPNTQALSISRQRFEEVAKNRELRKPRYYQSLDAIGTEFDIGVIATTSDVRRKVIEDLLSKTKVRYLILEKVAFQSCEDFEYIVRLLKSRNIKAWVNFPRRVIPFYAKLKEMISPHEQIFYNVQGGEWGLACNAIHFIDHVSFLIEETGYRAYCHGLDKKIKESKRKGFIEFTGSLHCNFTNGSQLNLISKDDSNCPPLISILTASMSCLIEEEKGIAWLSKREKNWKWQKTKFKWYFQSELTYKIIDAITNTGNCGLPTLEESYLLHKPLLNAFTNYLHKITDKRYLACPIT